MPYYWNILKPGTNGGGLVAWWEESWVLIVFKSWKHWSIEQCKHCTWRWFETNALVSCRSGLSLPHSLFSLDALLHLARSTPRWCHHFSSRSISKRSVYTFPLTPFTIVTVQVLDSYLEPLPIIAWSRLRSINMRYVHGKSLLACLCWGSLEVWRCTRNKNSEFSLNPVHQKNIRITEYRRVCKGIDWSYQLFD